MEIEDQSDWIRACDASAWPQVLPRLDVLLQTAAPPLRPPSRYLSSFFSLLHLWVCCGVWSAIWERELFLFELKWEYETLSLYLILSLSLWTVIGLALQLRALLYNFTIICPYFVIIHWCVLCWWVCLLVYCDLWIYLIMWLLSVEWEMDGAMGSCGVGYLNWGSKGRHQYIIKDKIKLC